VDEIGIDVARRHDFMEMFPDKGGMIMAHSLAIHRDVGYHKLHNVIDWQ
jgi:hypothetical protein